MKHEIWIELPDRNQKEHAKLATKMLHKMGMSSSVKFQYSETRGYSLICNSDGEFLELPDRGHWFNLDSLSK